MNWELLGKLAIGLLIGILCGAIPLAIGIFTSKKILGIVGVGCCALSGVLFSFLGKSAFTAVVVSILFVIFILIGNKKDDASTEKSLKTDATSKKGVGLQENDDPDTNGKTDTKN